LCKVAFARSLRTLKAFMPLRVLKQTGVTGFDVAYAATSRKAARGFYGLGFAAMAGFTAHED
jgi:hypothetical protein